MCLDNVLSFHKENNKKDFEMIREVLRDRNHLPEISNFALKMKFDDFQKQKLNNTIETLVQSNFIVKVFQSTEDL